MRGSSAPDATPRALPSPDAPVDLHVHTTHSDGRLSPTRVVEEAAARGLAAIAITDHDVVAGLAEARAAGERLGVEVVAGVELTADWDGRLVHVLGYFVDPGECGLRRALARAEQQMADHVRSVLDEARRLDVPIDEAALARYRARYVSGVTLVLAMVEQGVLRGSPHARRLLALASREPRAYSAEDAIALVHAAGGIASLAHPVRVLRDTPLLSADVLRPLVDAGLDGLEAWQIVHDAAAREHYLRLADDLTLVPTGGSDCHGPRRLGMRLGSQQVPGWVLSRMRARWRARTAPPARS